MYKKRLDTHTRGLYINRSNLRRCVSEYLCYKGKAYSRSLQGVVVVLV
jgi:hypothetical protein